MNLFFKSKTFFLIFFLLCASKSALLLGSNTEETRYLYPRILKYSIPEKTVSTPYTSFFKRDDGFMLLGGTDGILVMHGRDSYILNMPGPVYLASSDGRKVYYLAEKDFGYLELSPHDPPEIISLVDRIPSNHSSFYPYNCVANDSLVFMATSEGVFMTGDSSVDHLFLNRMECRLFSSGETVILQVEEMGIRTFVEDRFVPIECSLLQPGETINCIIDWQGRTYVLTSQGNVYDCSDTHVKTVDIVPPELRGIRKAFILPGDVLMATDRDHTAYIVDPGKNIVNIPGLSGELPLYMLNEVFNDEYNDSWLLYDFGLYKMEYPSVSSLLDLPPRLQGTILASLVRNNMIYLATSVGLVQLTITGNMDWEYGGIISPEKEEYLNILKSSGKLIVAAGNRSIYEVKGATCSLIGSGNFSSVFLQDEHTIFASSPAGLTRYERSADGWIVTMLKEEIRSVRDMTVFSGGLWTINTQGEILNIDLETGVVRDLQFTGQGSPVRIFTYNNSLYLSSKEHLYVYDILGEEFKPEYDTSRVEVFTQSKRFIAEQDEVWFIENNHPQVVFLNNFRDDRGTSSFFSFSLPGRLQRIIDINIQGKYVWITGEDCLMRIDTSFRTSKGRHELLIDRVYLRGSDIHETRIVEEGKRIRFTRDRMVFELLNTRYQTDPEPLFRFRMPPLQENWTPWNQQRSVSFSGLKSKTYTFQGQMKDISGDISETSLFRFTVRPPFYATWYAFTLYSLVLLFGVFLVYKWRMLGLKNVQLKLEAELQKKMDVLLREKDKSDRLVADLFPKGTAEELKSRGRAKSQKFEMVTVLFSDIQGFSHIAEEMNPEILIDELDKFFFHFDSVVEKYNIEKIKTIGDAYMAAGGIPQKNTTNPVEVVLAGLEMQYYMAELKKTKAHIWDLRIGIHSGPVISGVVGHKKLSYDIWGDTVNTASRMESSGEAGRVNISGITYALVKEYFICEYRGKLPVKYKGNIDMYFVNGLRPELSVDLHGIPNKRFFLKLQLLHLNDLEHHVFEDYLGEYPVTLHFRSKTLLKRIYDHTELLCRSESISEEDALITRTAALLMHTGLKIAFDNYENRSLEYAREVLPEYGYSMDQIDRVCNLILGTKEPYDPQSKLEEILIDAKMEFLGRPDYIKLVKLMFLEFKSNEREIAIETLIREQSELQDRFSYFTLAGQRLREIPPEEQKRNLKKLVSSM